MKGKGRWKGKREGDRERERDGGGDADVTLFVGLWWLCRMMRWITGVCFIEMVVC